MEHLRVITGTLHIVHRKSRRAIWVVALFYAAVYFLTFTSTVAVQRLLSNGAAPLKLDTNLILTAAIVFLSYIGVQLIGPSNIILFNDLQRDAGVKLMREAYDRVGRIPHQEFVTEKQSARIQRIMLLAQDSTLTQYTVHTISCAASFVCLAALMVVYRTYWYFILAIIVLNLLGFLTTSHDGLLSWQLQQAQADKARKITRYSDLFINKDALTEMRALAGEDFVFGQYKELQKQVWSETEKLRRKLARHQFIRSALQYSSLLLLLIFGVSMVLRHRMDAALFGWFFVLRQQIDQTCSHLFGEMNMVWNGMHDARELLDFLRQDAPEGSGLPEPEGDCGAIQMRNVGFSYGKEGGAFALEGADLTVQPGEKVMILGMNGSGKTTLIKNMIGLFSPQTGTVRIGAKSERISDSIGIVWQDFMKYSLLLRDNIAFGCIDKADDEAAIQNAASLADVDDSIRGNLDRYATKLFSDDGIDLSGGQWQQIALARGLAGDKPIIVLDEPTSMMDPLREQETFMRLLGKLSGQTVIFVSHRMGFARYVDKIVVLDGGKIIQCGRHEELIRKPGRYRQLYDAQAQWYK